MGRYNIKNRPLLTAERERRRELLFLTTLVVCAVAPRGANPCFLLALGCGALLARQRAAEARLASQGVRWDPPAICGLDRIVLLKGVEGVWNLLHLSLSDIRRIARRLLPAQVELGGHYGSVKRVDALATLLLRLVDPGTLLAHEELIGFPDFKQSAIIHATARLLVVQHGHILHSPTWLTPARLASYASAISQNGSPTRTVVGFIDGTRRPTTHPDRFQNVFYNGWKHIHNLLFISIAFPDGTFLLRGPVGGHQNDVGALNATSLARDLPRLFGLWRIGGDGGFPASSGIISISLFINAGALGLARMFASSRVAVEWLFADITNNFRFLQYKTGQKIHQTEPAVIYTAAAVLALARTTIHHNELSGYFHISPPSFEEIFH